MGWGSPLVLWFPSGTVNLSSLLTLVISSQFLFWRGLAYVPPPALRIRRGEGFIMTLASTARRGRILPLSPEDTGLLYCPVCYLLLPGQYKVPGKWSTAFPSGLAPWPRTIVKVQSEIFSLASLPLLPQGLCGAGTRAAGHWAQAWVWGRPPWPLSKSGRAKCQGTWTATFVPILALPLGAPWSYLVACLSSVFS